MVRLPIEGTLAQYDANAKVVLSNLQILARLLQSCIPEFADVSVQQIIDGAIRKDEIICIDNPSEVKTRNIPP